MKRKKLLYNSFQYSFFEARFLYKDTDPKAEQNTSKPKDGKEKAPEKPEAGKAEVVAESSRDQEKLKAQVDSKRGRDKTRKEIEKFRTEADIDKVFGITEMDDQKSILDKWQMNVIREKEKINSDNWKPQTKAGLDTMWEDWNNLQIPIGNPFYKKIYKELSKSHRIKTDPTFYAGKTDEQIQMYLNPDKYQEKLIDLDMDFYNAWKFHIAIKDFLKANDTAQNLTQDRVNKKDKDSIADGAYGAVKKNFNKFTKAIRERDYATAGLYVAGIWAMWKAYKTLPSDRQTTIGKYFIWGTALYAGNVFAKNAGFDIAKKLGLKYEDAEVRGTPLEALVRLGLPEVKDIDKGIYLRTSEMNMKNLHDLYLQTNNNGPRFINPALFPEQFPEFAGVSVTERMTNDDYRKAGEQLYLIIHCLRLGYERTMYVDKGSPYYQKTFEDALADGTIKTSTIREYTGALLLYAPSLPASKLFRPEIIKKGQSRVREIFKDVDANTELTPKSPDRPNAANGKIYGLPIVMVADESSKKYYIYDRKEYDDAKGTLAPSKALGSIDYEANVMDSSNAKNIKTNIRHKIHKYFEPLLLAGAKVTKKIEYRDGHWQVEYDQPALASFGIPSKRSTGKFEFDTNGHIRLLDSQSGHTIELGNLRQEDVQGKLLLANLVASKENAPLRPFLRSGKLHFKEIVSTAGNKPKFKVRIVGEDVEVTYDKTKTPPEFKIALTDQEELLKNGEFRREYANARMEYEEINRVFKQLNTLVNVAPENHHFHFVKGLGKWVTSGTADNPFRGVSSDVITGSIPDYYTNSVVASKKLAMRDAIEHRLGHSDIIAFSDISKVETDFVSDTVSDLETTVKLFSERSRKLTRSGKDWERTEFVNQVINKIQGAGNTDIYNDYLADVEKDFFAYGKAGGDIFKDSNNELVKLKHVFTYYTAHLNSSDLQNISYKTRPAVPDKNNPAHEIYFKMTYFKYVQNEIHTQMGEHTVGYPNPQTWRIENYKTWKEGCTSFVTLDPIDEKPPYKHDPKRPSGKPTELDFYYHVELKKMVDDIIAENEDKIHQDRVNEWFEEFTMGDGTNVPELENVTDVINTVNNQKRSSQRDAVQRSIKDWREALFRDKDMWKEGITLTERMKIWWRSK